jgi:hypothetical protein
MKRVIFYAKVFIIIVCFTGGFAALAWFLSSTILAKVFEAKVPVFTALLFLSLYMLLLFSLAIFTLFAAGLFICRANIRYKMSIRSFTILQPDAMGRQKESVFPPMPNFVTGLSGFGYFAPMPVMPFADLRNKPLIALAKEGKAPLDDPKDSHWAPSSRISAGNGATILPFPKDRKSRRKRR